MDHRAQLVDAAYRLDLAEAEQLQLVVDVLRRRFEPRRRVQAVTVRLADGKPSPRATVVDGDDLTDAEHAVVGGILRGSRTASIARERGVAERTVTNQLASAFQKLGVRSRILAVCRPASS